jgi:hypothetical protein
MLRVGRLDRDVDASFNPQSAIRNFKLCALVICIRGTQ